jgi:F-type H+-transporting ATPase subunit a
MPETLPSDAPATAAHVEKSHGFDFEALNASHNQPYPAVEWVHGVGPFKLILNLPDYASRNLAQLSHGPEFESAKPGAEVSAWAAEWTARAGGDSATLAKAMTVASSHATVTFPKALSFFTHQTFWSSIALVLIAVVLFAFRRKPEQLVPEGRVQGMLESLVVYIRDDVVRPNISHHADAWTPFLAGLFIMLLGLNLFGLVPIFATATGSIFVTAGLAVPIFLLMLFQGMKHNGVGGFWLKLVPVHLTWNPMDIFVYFLLMFLEWMSILIKPAVLAIRLFANMLAGHTLLLVFASLGFIVYSTDPTNIGMTLGLGAMGWVVAIAFYFLEVLVALVQAYVFVMLSAVFIGSCIHPEH